MKARRAASILVAAVITASMPASCSEKPAPDRETDLEAAETPRGAARVPEVRAPERQAALPPPSESEVGRDCAAFVRSTHVIPAKGSSSDCPGCPATGSEALTFHHVQTAAASCSGDTCHVMVKIRASFNPGSGGTLAGGLTAWIPVEQRNAYLSGHAPVDEQVYRVQITYKHRNARWHAVEFIRAPAE